MDEVNKSSYVVIEDYLSPEEVRGFLEATMAGEEEDGKPNFGYFPIWDISKQSRDVKLDWDPDNKIRGLLDFCEAHFLENYKILGTLEFNRVYGNIMHKGSSLPGHRDEDRNPQGEFDGKKRSFVGGLFLNDDYEGGELTFDDQGVALKPKPGTLVLFPGFYTNHGVNEILSGMRVNFLVFFYDMVDYKP